MEVQVRRRRSTKPEVNVDELVLDMGAQPSTSSSVSSADSATEDLPEAADVELKHESYGSFKLTYTLAMLMLLLPAMFQVHAYYASQSHDLNQESRTGRILKSRRAPSPELLWSNPQAPDMICPEGAAKLCEVPVGTNLTLDASMDVGALVIRGGLIWDTSKNGLELKAGYVVIEGPTGWFELGTPASPMLNQASIYLKNNGMEYGGMGKRAFGGYNVGGDKPGPGPSVHVHGKPFRHTWSLLVEDAASGAQSIRVQHDVATDDPALPGGGAWKVGDRLGLAPTGLPVTSPAGRHGGEVFTIVALRTEVHTTGPTTVLELDKALSEPRLGNVALKMQAEVVHLSRSVVVTGDDFDSDGHGLHTMIAGGLWAPPGRGGSLRIEYTRVEKCGQRGLQARYCMHFHLMSDCGGDGSPESRERPRCLLRGNAIENSEQRGIIVHGTHRSLVDNNVMWAVKGAGIYVEDGNEMGNVFRYNVNICPDSSGERQGCRAKGTDNEQSDDIQQSGMWALSVSNDFLFNRMVNHYNGFFTQTSAFPHGKGFALNKVCTMHAPFGNFTGNVHHTNWRFGFYLDNNFPRRLRRSIATNGMVEDFKAWHDGDDSTWSSCQPFTASERDNGAPAIVADGLDWGNNFVGQYELGDVQYLRFHAINNLHGLYWKQTKNFATLADIGSDTWDTGNAVWPQGQTLPRAHIKDSIFEFNSDQSIMSVMGSPGAGVGHVLGPGGHGAFLVEGTRFSGRTTMAALASNQHCGVGPGTGGLCTPEFELVNVDFSGMASSTKWIQFGVSNGDDRLSSFSTFDATSLAGYAGVAPKHQDHLLHTGICQKASDVSAEVAKRFDDGILCSEPLRRLQLWRSMQKGGSPILRLDSASGVSHNLDFVLPPAGGHEHHTKRGYGAIVVPGRAYTLSNLEALPGDLESGTTLEFSDRIYGDHFARADTLQLSLVSSSGTESRVCTVSSQHDRSSIAQSGPLRPGRGACTGKPEPTHPPEPPSPTVAPTTAPTAAPTVAPPHPPAPTAAPTAPPTVAPPHPPAPTAAPTAAPTSAPTVAPPTAAPQPFECQSQTCPHRKEWPQALHACSGSRLLGEVIRTDRHAMRLCNDCAERCFFQIWNCVGYTFWTDKGAGSPGSCTYYSSITGLAPEVLQNLDTGFTANVVVSVITPAHLPSTSSPVSTSTGPPVTSSTALPTSTGAPETSSTGSPITTRPQPPKPQGIVVAGRQVFVDGLPIHLKGVNWNPVPKGGKHPQNLDFAGFVTQDAKLMSNAGINALRTYEAITDKSVLDTLWEHGIYVLNTVYPWGGAAVDTVDSKVRAVKDHPAILMWVIGNEWNYNGLYYGMSFDDCVARIRDVALRIKDLDSSHPIATIYGHLPSSSTLAALNAIDVWGLNVYTGISFGDLFTSWAGVSKAPMFFGEYGADAYDATIGRENQDAQAEATTALTQEIISNSAVEPGGVCLGGLVFELADEWWKDSAGSAAEHDIGGIAPGGGPHPDATFNEEWWGLVDIDRNPRKAYQAYAKTPMPGASTTKLPEPTKPPTTGGPGVSTTKLPEPQTTEGPVTSHCQPQKCSHRNNWPMEMQSCPGEQLEGDAIRTDRGVRLCRDCAERCFFQIPHCIGFTFETDQGDGDVPGACTFYRRIAGRVASSSSNRVIAIIGTEPLHRQVDQDQVPYPGTYVIKNVNSGKVMNVQGNYKDNGGNIWQWDNPHETSSQWYISAADTVGAYVLTNVNSGKVASVLGNSMENGGNIHQCDNPHITSSHWHISNANSDGAHVLRNVNSGKVMNVEGNSKDNGGNIWQWDNPHQTSSQWYISAAATGVALALTDLNTGKAEDFNSTTPGELQSNPDRIVASVDSCAMMEALPMRSFVGAFVFWMFSLSTTQVHMR